MPTFHVDLQDGFAGDRVVVRVEDREVFRGENLTTKLMLGYAESLEFEVAESRVTVRVEVPTRDVSGEQEVRAETPYVGVSLEGPLLSLSVSRTPFAYL